LKRRSGEAATGKRGGRCRIVDAGNAPGNRFRKDSLTLKKGGYRRDAHPAHQLARALVISKPEGAIAGNRSAQHKPILVSPKEGLIGFAGRRGSKQIAGVQGLIAEELKHRAVNLIRSRARGKINDAAAEAAKLRRRTVGFHL